MDIAKAVDQMFDSIKNFIQRSLEPRDAQLRRLAARIDELEARLNSMPAVEYVGVHEQGKQYARGQLVTHRGSLWHCQRPTTQRPGESVDWKLCVKSGRDGRDIRRRNADAEVA